MGLQARLMSQALRKLTATIARSRTIVVFINQIRMKIGVMFGNPETTTGGNALKFYASVRMDIRRIGAIKQGDEVIGSRTKVKIVKNKVAPPFREAEFDILYGKGISRDGELIDLGAEDGILEKSGSWYAFEGERIGQGRENAKEFLADHRDVAEKIEAKVRAKHGVPAKGGRAAAAAAAAGAAPGDVARPTNGSATAAGTASSTAPTSGPGAPRPDAAAAARGRAEAATARK
jgi:recombination protein RecA